MTAFLQKGAPALAAWAGIALFVLGWASRSEVFLLAGAILFGAATIAAQLAKLAELWTSDLSKK